MTWSDGFCKSPLTTRGEVAEGGRQEHKGSWEVAEKSNGGSTSGETEYT